MRVAALDRVSHAQMMRFSKPIFVVLASAFFAPAAYAADMKGVTYSIEPIIGYELQRKTDPDRSKLVLTYGARVVAGYKILAAEGEYTQGKSDEFFSNTNTQIEEKSEKIRLGLRSTFSLGSMLDWFLRGGAEAQKINRTTTISGVSTSTESPSKVYPYIGTGLSLALGSTFSLNGSIIATLKDTSDMKKNEYTTTFGLKVALNTTR